MGLEQRPIFIVGAPRSGTTLMRSILDAHPNIFSPAWETGLFQYMSLMINGDLLKFKNKYKKDLILPREDYIAWVKRVSLDLITMLRQKSEKQRWAEKTPGHVHSMDFIHEVYPDAQFIHMIRRGSDVVKSLQNMHWAPRRIRWSINTWVESVQAGRSSGARLPAGHYTEIRYEELIRTPHEVLKQLCDYLGEPFAEQMLEFHNPEKNTSKAELKPLQSKPVNDYQDLTLWQRLVFRSSAGWLMRDLGYS